MKLFLIPILFLSGCISIPIKDPTPKPTPIQTCPEGKVKVPVPGGEFTCQDPVISNPLPIPITSCSFPQGVPEDQFVQVPNPGLFNDKVNQIVSNHTGCAINSNCILGSSDPQFYLTTIINWLLEDGLCAGQHVNGQSDEIAVSNSCEAGVVWESYHIVNFGDSIRKVAWSALKPAYKVPVGCTGTNPPVKPTPLPPNPSCGESPRPPCNETVNCPPSLDRINLAVRDQAAWIVDATPQTGNKDWCNANGFAGRNFCPLGPEGSDSRPVCEAKFGPYVWTLNGSLCGNGSSACFPNGDPPNPLQLRVPKPASGTVKICAPNNVCGEGVIQ